jgi:predicted ATPase
MIEALIERLSPEEQCVLELASIAGASFSATIINLEADVDPQTLEDVCERLSSRHQIVRRVAPWHSPDGTSAERYEFVHALYRQVIYDRLAPRRRATLHRRIGERLAALHPNACG